MLCPIPVAELLRVQQVETRYEERNGTVVKDLRTLPELPELVDQIESAGGKLLSVSALDAPSRKRV